MNSTTYDGMLNNIIAYYGLLVAILLPAVILLIENMKNSPGIDKQILFRKIFPVKYLGILLGAFILPGLQFLLFYSHLLEYTTTRMIVAVTTVITTSTVFFLIIKIMAWISSGENKDAFHGYYRQNIRSEFLEEGSIKERSEKWYQFWSDEKNIKYFGHDICRYIDDFFTFIHNVKKEDWKYIKKSCYAFYYNLTDMYKFSKKEIRLNAYDDRSLLRQLVNTIPYCICSNLIEGVDSNNVERDGIFIWSNAIVLILLEEIEKESNLENNEWLIAFNLFFFGTKKDKDKSLTAATMVMACFHPSKEMRQNIKKRIDKFAKASNSKYKPFYQQIYKEIFCFNPNKSKLLKMMEKGVSNE